MPAVPPRIRVRLPYTTTLVLGDGSATAAYAVWRLNGPLDPEVSLGGANPLGYTELTAQYEKAIVHRSSFKASVTVRDSATIAATCGSCVVGLHYTPYIPDGGITGFDTLNELRVRAHQKLGGDIFKWRTLVRNAALAYNTAGNSKLGACRLPSLRFNMREQGLTTLAPYGRVGTADPYGLTFDTAGTPDNQMYITTFAFGLPQNGDSLVSDALPYLYWDVTIWYDIEFFAPYFQVQ